MLFDDDIVFRTIRTQNVLKKLFVVFAILLIALSIFCFLVVKENKELLEYTTMLEGKYNEINYSYNLLIHNGGATDEN